MSSIKVEVVKVEDAEGNQSIALKYEGRDMLTWTDLLREMQREFEFDLIITGPWREVESSNLVRVFYDEPSHILYVQFHSGQTYKYEDIGPLTYAELMSATSKGRYFASHIKDKYPCEKV